MRIVTVLARHDTHKYAEAIAVLDQFFAVQLPQVERQLIVVDNSLPEDYELAFGRGRVVIGSSNSSWEFSAWDRGLRYLGSHLSDYDLVHLATSAFKALKSEYLELFDTAMLDLVLGGGPSALGHVDAFPEPVILMGRSLQAWIRSSWIFLPPREVELLGSVVSISDRAAFFSGDPHSPFQPDAPLSGNYQRYILDWQTGGGLWTGSNAWHSRFDLTRDTLAYFEAKAVAIMNEQMLSLRLRRQGCAMVDVTWLAALRANWQRGDPLASIPSWQDQVTARYGFALG